MARLGEIPTATPAEAQLAFQRGVVREQVIEHMHPGDVALFDFIHAVLDFPDLQALAILRKTEPQVHDTLDFILVSPSSSDDPATAPQWDAVAEARATLRAKTPRGKYFIGLSAIDSREKDVDALLADANDEWEKDRKTEVLFVTKLSPKLTS